MWVELYFFDNHDSIQLLSSYFEFFYLHSLYLCWKSITVDEIRNLKIVLSILTYLFSSFLFFKGSLWKEDLSKLFSKVS